MRYPRLAWWLAAWLLAAFTFGTLRAQPATAAAVMTIDRADAVRASWDSVAPPVTGWTPVKLMDYWNIRWPHHDGVVWYRLHWTQASADA